MITVSTHTSLNRQNETNMLVAARPPTGVLFAVLLATSAPIAQAASHGANCQDGMAGSVRQLQLDAAGVSDHVRN